MPFNATGGGDITGGGGAAELQFCKETIHLIGLADQDRQG